MKIEASPTGKAAARVAARRGAALLDDRVPGWQGIVADQPAGPFNMDKFDCCVIGQLAKGGVFGLLDLSSDSSGYAIAAAQLLQGKFTIGDYTELDDAQVEYGFWPDNLDVHPSNYYSEDLTEAWVELLHERGIDL